uniref:Uncharacterized protein n=1 Tax=Ascaris lumbricoides TaxID=6252 RepID=A0A0M3IL31_ASCLU
MMLSGLYNLLFIEEYRESRRKRLGRSKFADIFYYSGVYDYRLLRYLINFPIGFLISSALYAFGNLYSFLSTFKFHSEVTSLK